MNDRDVETTSTRTAWGMVIGAISLATAWAWRQVKERRSELVTGRPIHSSVAHGPSWAGSEPLDRRESGHVRDRSREHDKDDQAPKQLKQREGSALSQLKEDFSRFPPKTLAKRIWGKISEDEITTLSTSFAYHWVFAIPPLLILIVMIAALLNNVSNVPVVENLREVINERAPADTRQLLLDLVNNAVAKVGGNVASLGAIVTAATALWAGSNAVGILIKGFNRAYDVDETRPYVRKKGLAIGLTLVLVLFVNLAFALLVFGRQIGEWITGWVGLGATFDTVWSLSRWPIAILGIMLLLATLYWAGPNVDQPFQWLTLGSLIATLLWLALVAAFSLYLQLSNPGSTYGVVGSVIVLLVFLNFTGIIFFLGAEISAILSRAVNDDTESALAD